MQAPSVDKLTSAFKIAPDVARHIRTLCHKTDEPGDLEDHINRHCPTTAAYARSCHSSPFRNHIWRVTMVLHAIDVLVQGYGVEGLGPGRNGDQAPPYEYINLGDPYTTTLIYDRDGDRLFIGCWGDIAEKHEDW